MTTTLRSEIEDYECSGFRCPHEMSEKHYILTEEDIDKLIANHAPVVDEGKLRDILAIFLIESGATSKSFSVEHGYALPHALAAIKALIEGE